MLHKWHTKTRVAHKDERDFHFEGKKAMVEEVYLDTSGTVSRNGTPEVTAASEMLGSQTKHCDKLASRCSLVRCQPVLIT